MKQLYPHQVNLVNMARMTGKKSVLLAAPTGIGKSVIASSIVQSAMIKDKRCWFIVPRRELLRQMSGQFNDFDIEHSYIAQGFKYQPLVNTTICSLQSLVRRVDSMVAPDLAVIDETHYGSVALDTVIKWLKANGTFILGLSATPIRLDGKGLGCWYDAMVEGPSIRWLIDNGYLSDYRAFAPDILDLSGIRKLAGDYNQRDLADKMESDRVLVGNCVKHYMKHAMGLRGVTFTVSRKHSSIVCDAYNAAGIPAACIDGETPDDERKRLAQALANRDILQLVNVELLTFGYDLSAAAGQDVTIEAMSDLRPTKSLALQMQKWGRVLRKKDKPAIILDHANNIYEHGKPCDERQWTLADREKRGAKNQAAVTVPIKHCPSCYFIHKPAPFCPNCGTVYPVVSREIDEVEGELREIDMAAIKKQKRQEVGGAKTIAELRAIAQERGYNSNWVYVQAKVKGIKE